MMPSSTHRLHALQAAWSSLSSRVMLRLGLIGDTQGRYRVERLLRFVAGHFEDVDEIWHVGDWQESSVLEGLKALGKPLTVVNGNAPDDPSYPMQVRRRIEGLEVGMVHRPPRKGDAWAARAQDAALFAAIDLATHQSIAIPKSAQILLTSAAQTKEWDRAQPDWPQSAGN